MGRANFNYNRVTSMKGFWWRVILIMCLCSRSSIGCLEEERRALLSINSLDKVPREFDDWRHTTEETNCCSWPRVTCNSRGRVVSFNAPKEFRVFTLAGSIDISIFAPLTELRELDFSSNQITGFYSSTGFNGLQKLKKLQLYNNFLTDRGVVALVANLTSLIELHIDGNQLRGARWISNLTSLEILDMSYNQLQELDGFNGLQKLKKLHLYNNYLTDRGVDALVANLPSLIELRIDGNQLRGTSSISNLTSLEILDMSYNQLQELDSVCQLNQLRSLHLQMNEIHSRIDHCFDNMNRLEQLDLGSNILSGNIGLALQNLSQVESTDISNNEFRGVLHLSMIANISNLKELIFSNNDQLEIETEVPTWIPSFQLSHIYMDNCIINRLSGGKIPTFLLGQTDITDVDLSHSSLNGIIPPWLFYNITNSLSLTGNKLDLAETFSLENKTSQLTALDLSDSQITMQLPKDFDTIFPSLVYLNISNNALYGQIPSLGVSKILEVLDLSSNHLDGEIPQSLTGFPSALNYLILSDNSLQGGMLPRNSCMPNLLLLELDRNRFTGGLSPDLSCSFSLYILNLSDNDLQGTVPSWLFTFNSSVAEVILLKSNHFEGSIPKEWCDIIDLHILDLSDNSFSGPIPNCLSDLYATYSSAYLDSNFIESYPFAVRSPSDDSVNFTSKGASLSYRGIPLRLFIGLDFSMNQLSGVIPLEMGFVPGLKSLNLSFNHLDGPIPDTFKYLKDMESLDLSHNDLAGSIPSELTQLSSLSYFVVAYNNLSGEIPSQGQFLTFNESFFEGNAGLCGQVVQKKCPSTTRPSSLSSGGLNTGVNIMDSPTVYWSFVFGCYAIGFWASIAFLIWNTDFQEKWFRMVDCLITCHYREVNSHLRRHSVEARNGTIWDVFAIE